LYRLLRLDICYHSLVSASIPQAVEKENGKKEEAKKEEAKKDEKQDDKKEAEKAGSAATKA